MKVAFCSYAHLKRNTRTGTPVPENYNFWKELVSYFIPKVDNFRLKTWIDEEEAIKISLEHGKEVQSDQEYVRIFQGDMKDKFIQQLLDSPFDKEEKIMWDTIELRNGDNTILTISDYGTKFKTAYLEEKFIEDILYSNVLDEFITKIYDRENIS